MRILLLLAAVMLCLSSCGSYDPPVQADHASPHYQKDLTDCRTSSRETVRLKNAGTLARWVISPITGPPAVRAAIRKCLAGKGYALARTSD